jgi:hypothetical protein
VAVGGATTAGPTTAADSVDTVEPIVLADAGAAAAGVRGWVGPVLEWAGRVLAVAVPGAGTGSSARVMTTLEGTASAGGCGTEKLAQATGAISAPTAMQAGPATPTQQARTGTACREQMTPR